MKPLLSVIIIVKNEESRIRSCLESVRWADEIVVVDSGSTDGTRDVCESFPNVRFFDVPWKGFGPQKNAALDQARGEWVFSIDADEHVPESLADEIKAVIGSSGSLDGYFVKRKNFYRNYWVRHCGWWPDHVLRLFRNGKGRFNDRVVHEAVIVTGTTGYLQHPVEHYSYRSVSEFIGKIEPYSTLGAEQMRRNGKTTGIAGVFLHTIASFVKTYVVKGGVLDGRAGLLISCSNAAGVFFRYMKLLEMQEK